MAVPALATEESIRDVIERITAEGQLTRNSGTNSIKSIYNYIGLIADILADTYNMMDNQLEELVEASTANKFKKEEDEVEASRKGGGKADVKEADKLAEAAKNTGFFGLLLAAITGALVGLSAGLIAGFANVAKTILKAFDRFILRGAFGKLTNGIKTIGKTIGADLTKLFKSIRGSIAATAKMMRADFTKLFGRVGGGVSKFLKPIGDFIGRFVDIVKDIGTTIKNVFGSAGKSFTKVKTFITGIGKTVMKFGKIFGTFFSKFAVLGRFIAWPITIITGLVAAVKAFTETEGSMGDKLLAGAVAAFDVIILAPLDLLREGVAWILGKLGFDDSADALKSFSFSEMFANLISSVVENFTKLIDWFKEKIKEYNPIEAVKKGFGKIGEFFGGGDDEELDDEVRGEDGLTAKHRKEIRDYEARMQYFARLNARDSATQLDAPADELESRRAKVEQMRNERESKQSGGVNASVNAPTDNSVKSTTTVHVSKPNVRPVNEEQTFNGLNSVYG